MSDRTYDATPRHKEEMRKRGDVLLSPDLSAAITLLIAVYFLSSRVGDLMQAMVGIMRETFSQLGAAELTDALVQEGAVKIASEAASALMPLLLTIAGVGILVGLVQTRGVVAISRLKPDFSRINPAKGIKRIFSSQGLLETVKGLIKMAVLALVLYSTVKKAPADLAVAAQAGFWPGFSAVGVLVSKLAKQAALLLLMTAGIDYAYQFFQYRKRTKMTREEVMEEMKSAEGQPFIKAKIREMQRRWSRQRMMQELVHADVVVTNPTHLAIALRYDSKKMMAPVVVAKGQDRIAEQIVKRARELNIPIMQNIPLAHALIKVELQAQIPVELYQAVAEVLAFVYRLRKKGTVN